MGRYGRLGLVAMTISPLAFIQGVVASSIKPSSGVVQSRYWRVRVRENQSLGSTLATSADHVQFRSTFGGINLATDPLKGLADSVFSGSYIEDYAFNGIGSGFWVSENNNYGTHWIGYDFTTPVSITEIVWSKRPDSYGRVEAPIFGVVERSDDGSNWVYDWNFFTPANWGAGAETRTFQKSASSGKRAWRIRPTALQGSAYPFSTAEVEFRATAGGPNKATGGVPISSAQNFSYPKERAFDGITNVSSNFFLSTGKVPSGQPWIGYLFPDVEEIVQVYYQVRGDGFGANEAVIAGVLESTKDYVTWTIEWSFSTPATWVNNSTEFRIFTKP